MPRLAVETVEDRGKVRFKGVRTSGSYVLNRRWVERGDLRRADEETREEGRKRGRGDEVVGSEELSRELR